MHFIENEAKLAPESPEKALRTRQWKYLKLLVTKILNCARRYNFVRFTSFVLLLAVVIGGGWSVLVPNIQQPSPDASKVTWIIDGDTFVLEKHVRVRLLGIDAPETASSPKLESLMAEGHDRDSIVVLGDAALKYCIAQYKGKTVRLERDGIQPDKDQFGRLLRYLYLDDGTCINEELLRKGYAEVYRRADFEKREEFLAAESTAKSAGRGIWAK